LAKRLTTPPAIRTLQRKLYVKAKTEPAFRFYRLYDKVYRADILAHAYALAKANGGASGVDGVTFEDVDAAGQKDWLAALREDLRPRRYRPAAVRRVYIPKPGGGERPVRDSRLLARDGVRVGLCAPQFGEDARRADQWARRVAADLKAGQVEAVIARLHQLQPRLPEAAAARDAVIRYYTTHAHRMRYDEYLAQGYGIGSGAAQRAPRAARSIPSRCR
jgi:hypothetical protein